MRWHQPQLSLRFLEMELMADDDIITPPTLANFHEDIYDAFIFM